jgi:hypothetical protein
MRRPPSNNDHLYANVKDDQTAHDLYLVLTYVVQSAYMQHFVGEEIREFPGVMTEIPDCLSAFGGNDGSKAQRWSRRCGLQAAGRL